VRRFSGGGLVGSAAVPALYLALASLLAVMTYDVHQMLGQFRLA
jgi:hypothetical protein